MADGRVDGKEEQETFLNDTKAKQPPKAQSIFQFIYNPSTGRVLGRTWLGLGQIIFFYIVFYACLIAFWALLLFLFLQTLDEKQPRYYGKGTVIGINPGMGYQPWLKNDPGSTLIRFNPKNPATYAKYVAAIDDFLDKHYNATGTRECAEPAGNWEEGKEPCGFNLKPIADLGCNKGSDYGFSAGKPCVFLTLNRLIGWQPVAYPGDSVPVEVEGRYKSGDVAVNCRGEYAADDEHVGPPQYAPSSGLEGKYFPYRHVANYHQPVAVAKFSNLKKGVLTMVECKAYSYNIVHDSEDRMGLIHFELLVEQQDFQTDDS